MSCNRILVHEKPVLEFTEKFMVKMSQLPVGTPDDPAAKVGPMVNTAAAQRVSGLIKNAVAAGATVLAGGEEPSGPLHPLTLLTNVPVTAQIYYAETFGPVCAIDTFAAEDEAVAKSND